MRPPGYGEDSPRLDDDRRPVVLVVLDGLGDRPVPELGGRTPAEAARTPVLDELARRGASGWHLPFGWGRAASSEVSHWSMFGYEGQPFPGRAVLEGLGAGLPVPHGVAALHGSLRTSTTVGQRLWVQGRAAQEDAGDAARLLAELAPEAARCGVELQPLGSRGEALVLLPRHDTGLVSDSDPFFEHLHPVLRPVATGPEGEALAADVTALLLLARTALTRSEVNRVRLQRGLPALDVLTTKWAGARAPLPAFAELAGLPGAAVTSSRLYRGFAALLDLASRDLPAGPDLTAEMTARLAAAEHLLADGAGFVHVHTKAPDEAGHSKRPYAKRDVLEAVDAGLAPLLDLAERAVVAVTGDHATPSTGGVLHTGDPTPFVVAGGAVRCDRVREFGETQARDGDLGVLRAADVLPLLLGAADRPAFLGSRPGRTRSWGLPDRPEALLVPAVEGGPEHPGHPGPGAGPRGRGPCASPREGAS